MERAKKVTLCVLLVLSLFVFASCGKKKADPNKPITEVKAEAEKMNTAELKAMVADYTKLLDAKKAEVEKIMAELKKVPLTEMTGDKAKELKADVDTVNKAIAAINERMRIYQAKIK